MTESSRLLSIAGGSLDSELTGGVHDVTLDELYNHFGSTRWGFTTEEAKRSRRTHGLNNTPAPLAAPAWLCCLLPCLMKTKSMEQFHECVPEYAYVMRNKRWVKMDSASIVPGDLIRVEAGERVCADSRVIEANGCIFDTTYVHSGSNPLHIDHLYAGEAVSYLHSPKMAFLGYLCISGSCNCIVVNTGSSTIVAKLINKKIWPPKQDI